MVLDTSRGRPLGRDPHRLDEAELFELGAGGGEPFGGDVAAELFALLGETEALGAGPFEGFVEAVGRVVPEGVAEDVGDGRFAVFPHGVGGFEVLDVDEAGAVEEGVGDAQAEALGLGVGGDGAGQASGSAGHLLVELLPPGLTDR